MRKPATLNFGNLDTSPKPKGTIQEKSSKKREMSDVATIAAKEGFTSRSGFTAKVDGRTLRKTGRTSQLNISVKPETKSKFWETAHAYGFSNGESFLLELLASFEQP